MSRVRVAADRQGPAGLRTGRDARRFTSLESELLPRLLILNPLGIQRRVASSTQSSPKGTYTRRADSEQLFDRARTDRSEQRLSHHAIVGSPGRTSRRHRLAGAPGAGRRLRWPRHTAALDPAARRMPPSRGGRGLGVHQAVDVGWCATQVRLHGGPNTIGHPVVRSIENAIEHGFGAVMIFRPDLYAPTRRQRRGDRAKCSAQRLGSTSRPR